MFLLAYEPIQACQLMEKLFGWVKQGFWTITGLNFNWKHEHKQWRRGKQSEENSCNLLSHFLKSIFCMLYTILKIRKSKIQCFKRCTIRSWNEEVRAIGSLSHQAESQFRRLRNGVRNQPLAAKRCPSACEISQPSFTPAKFSWVLPDICDRHF